MHVRVGARVCVCARVLMHVCVHGCACVCTCTYVQAPVCACAHERVHTRVCACVCVCVCVHARTAEKEWKWRRERVSPVGITQRSAPGPFSAHFTPPWTILFTSTDSIIMYLTMIHKYLL